MTLCFKELKLKLWGLFISFEIHLIVLFDKNWQVAWDAASDKWVTIKPVTSAVFVYTYNKPGPAQVGAISKAQK